MDFSEIVSQCQKNRTYILRPPKTEISQRSVRDQGEISERSEGDQPEISGDQ